MSEDKIVQGQVKEQNAYVEKANRIFTSLRDHLTPAYRKQYNIRRVFSCVVLFLLLRYMQDSPTSSLIAKESILPFIWTVLAFVFWKYSFWSFQGGVIDNFSRGIIYIGSFWSLLWKIVVQNIVIVVWIALIAPFSGIKTWRKAVKQDKQLFIDNAKENQWN